MIDSNLATNSLTDFLFPDSNSSVPTKTLNNELPIERSLTRIRWSHTFQSSKKMKRCQIPFLFLFYMEDHLVVPCMTVSFSLL